MKLEVPVEIDLQVSADGITVGRTIITWGWFLAQPEVQAKIKELTCQSCPSKANEEAIQKAVHEAQHKPYTGVSIVGDLRA